MKVNTGCLCCEKGISKERPRQCPICGDEFQGNGWDAYRREKYLKTSAGKRYLRDRLKEHLETLD